MSYNVSAQYVAETTTQKSSRSPSQAKYWHFIWQKRARLWLLRNLADTSCGMLKGCVAFHSLQFLQVIHLLCLMVLPLVLSVPILFALVEHSKLEQIDFGTTIHASFNELEPVHIAFQRTIAAHTQPR